MIKENELEFKQANIIQYQNLPKKSDVGAIVILDSSHRPRKHDNIEIVIDSFRADDNSGHNTNVCAVTRQVAPDARIISFNYFGSEKEQIIDWIIEHKSEVAVVNCSFNSPTKDVIERMEAEDILVLSSSGNNGRENSISYPSNLPWIISIGAFEAHRQSVSDYSNGGEGLDCVAFTDIWFPVTADYSKLHWFNGTSTSSPVASAMLWNYMSRISVKLKRQEARDFIHRNCVDLLDQGFDYKSGYGLFVLPKYETLKRVILRVGSHNILVNDKPKQMDVAPFVENARTYVPLRFVAEELGCIVEWNTDIKQVTIIDGNKEIKLLIGSKTIIINGESKQMDVAPFIENGRTFIPIRFVAEELGCHVGWTPETKEINIVKQLS